MRRVARHRRSHAGFTLVELIAMIAILGALGTGAASIMYTASDGFLQATTRAQLHAETSVALDRIIRELHNIPLDTGATGVAPDIASVTASSITWNTDYSLSLSGTNLMFSDDGASAAVLLADVTTFTIQTYDESNTALAASLSGTGCDPIRRIQVTITTTRSGISETIRSRAFLRTTVSGAES